MKFNGYTDDDDWNVKTLLWMMCRRECWQVELDWKDWRLQSDYTWYDGPHWQLGLGPLYIHIGY